jgi:predicted ester cyclase
MGNAIVLISQIIESYFGEVWKTGQANLPDSPTIRNYLSCSPMPIAQGSNSASFEPRKRFPDLNYEIRDLVITADKIVANVVLTGKQLTELCRLQPNLK